MSRDEVNAVTVRHYADVDNDIVDVLLFIAFVAAAKAALTLTRAGNKVALVTGSASGERVDTSTHRRVDVPSRRQVDAPTRGRVDASTRRRVDAWTRGRVDAWTRRRVDAWTRRRVDASTRGRVDALMRRRVDASTRRCSIAKRTVQTFFMLRWG